jgi:integrase
MKAGRPHRVALSSQAIALLGQIRCDANRDAKYVFPSKNGRPLSHMALNALLGRMGRGNVTPHGMRATFATWAREETLFQREVIEAALAHRVGDATERAYARGDALEKRRALMEAWATYLAQEPQSAEIVPLRKVG